MFAVKKDAKKKENVIPPDFNSRLADILSIALLLLVCTMSYATFCNMPPGEKTMIATCIVICFDLHF